MLRRTRRQALVLAAVAALAATATTSLAAARPPAKGSPVRHAKAAHRLQGVELLQNGSFEGSLAGWGGYAASLSLAGDGVVGSWAARVALASSKTRVDSFSIYQATPVSATQGTTYSAGAWVRSDTPGREVCLRIRERSNGTETGAAKACVSSTRTWQKLGPLTFAVQASGRQLDVYAYQWAPQKGDSFELDGVSFASLGAPPPPPPPTPPAIQATAVDNAHARLDWGPVAGAATYRVTRGSLVVGTTSGTSFTDALLWPGTTYAYQVAALGSGDAALQTLSASATTSAIPTAGVPRPFGASTFWNTPIGGAATAANGAAQISFFVAHALNPNMTLRSWAVPVAEAHPSDPLYGVPCTLYACTLGAFGQFAIPVTAVADPSADGYLAVYDPASQREWDMWQAKNSGGWSASAGSAVSTTGDGITPPGTAGADAANWPLLGGLVRPEEILQGHIDHALVFGMPAVNNTRYVCPATHHDGGSSDPSSLPEGTRLQLDPSLDVSTLAIPGWEKTIARALQTYGMYLRDTGGSLAIYAENPISRGYDAWSLAGLPAGDSVSLAGIPWSRFRVVRPPC